MAKDRTGYAPWSLTREAGVQSATVDGTIAVPQNIQPVLSAGFVDYKGNWKGTTSSDEEFFISDTAEGIANGATVLFPNTADRDFIDMTGFKDLVIAIKPSNGGTTGISAVMGPDSNRFANLSPVRAAADLRFSGGSRIDQAVFYDVLQDTNETTVADVWNIYTILGRCMAQKNMQIKITNSTGGSGDWDFAYLRIV